MGKSLEHFYAPRTCFFMRGLGGRVGLGGLIRDFLEEDWPSQEALLAKRKIPRLWGEVRDGLIF